MKKTYVFWGALSFIFLLSACFHGRQSTSVIGYRHQMVFLKKNLYYNVGQLTSDWKRLNVRAKTVAFHNNKLGATISTDAFCGGSFEDLPLRTLTGQLFAGTGSRKVIKEEELTLDGRGALRTVSTGTTDGVNLKFDSVVLKKDNCTIDFIYISPPENFSAGVSDFENFYKGFQYQ